MKRTFVCEDGVCVELADCGCKSLDSTRYSYKLNESSYGLDAVITPDTEVNESEMSAWIPYADGRARDGVGDLLEVGGIKFDRHKINPIILFDHGKGSHKFCTWPIALAEDRVTHEYKSVVDPIAQTAKDCAYFYQGTGVKGVGREDEREFALYCEQIFDLLAKRYIRGGSIGYQAIKALPLQPDYETGMPQGLHLISVLKLESSVVILPANMSTVLKNGAKSLDYDYVREILSMSKVCGKQLSPYLVKSFQPYAPEKTKVVSGYEKKGSNPTSALQKIGEELARHENPAPMPGYGQIFIKENGSGEAWYVGGDGDEDGFGKLVFERLTSVQGIDEVNYEAEAFPPKGEGWVQVYPEQREWKALSANSETTGGALVKPAEQKKKDIPANTETAPPKHGDMTKTNVPPIRWKPGAGAVKGTLHPEEDTYRSLETADSPMQQKSQPSDDISPEKAKEVLKDGSVHGHPLTEKQERMFGAAAGKDRKALRMKYRKKALPSYQQAKGEGADAYRAGKTIKNNPYDLSGPTPDRELSKAWLAGFSELYHQNHKSLRLKYRTKSHHIYKLEVVPLGGSKYKVALAGYPKSSVYEGGKIECDAYSEAAGGETLVKGDPATYVRKKQGNSENYFSTCDRDKQGHCKNLAVVAVDPNGTKYTFRLRKNLEGSKKAFNIGDLVFVWEGNSKAEGKVVNRAKDSRGYAYVVQLTSGGTINARENEISGATGASIKSLSPLRLKYRNVKNCRRRMKSSQAGSSMLYVHGKDLDAVKKAAEERGLQFSHVGSHENGAAKVRLSGADESIDHIAKAWGRKVKGLEMRVKGLGFNVPITIPDPKKLVELFQKSQLAGIDSRVDGDVLTLSGVDEMEIGRFLRQHQLLPPGEIQQLFGGTIGTRQKSMKIAIKSKEPKVEVWEDDSDPNNPGWSWRVRFDDGHEESGEADSEADGRKQARGVITHRNSKKPKGHGSGDSYFSSCDRDDQGHCKNLKGTKSMKYSKKDQATLPNTGEIEAPNAEMDELTDETTADEGGETEEKYGAQCLRQIHKDHLVLMEAYDEMLQLLEEEGVADHVRSRLEELESTLTDTEALFEKTYDDLPPLEGAMDKDLEEAQGEEHVEEESGDHPEEEEEVPEEEAVEGMQTKRLKYKKKACSCGANGKVLKKSQKSVCTTCGKSPCVCNMNKDLGVEQGHTPGEEAATGSTLQTHEYKSIGNAANFLNEVSQAPDFGDEHRMKSYHHHQVLDEIAGNLKGMNCKSFPEAAKEDSEVDVTKPSSDSTYTPGKEPMQQEGKDFSAMEGEDQQVNVEHPHLKALTEASGFLRDLSTSHDLTDEHKMKAIAHYKALDPIGKEDQTANVTEPTSPTEANPGTEPMQQFDTKALETLQKRGEILSGLATKIESLTRLL